MKPFLASGLIGLVLAIPARTAPQEWQTPSEILVLPSTGNYGRVALPRDAVQAAIVAGKWQSPKAGDKVQASSGKTVTWEVAKTQKPGTFNHAALRGGYAFWKVHAKARQVLLLEASGHGMVYVNGEPRVGDIYQNGLTRVRIAVQPGANSFLFHVGRGQLQVKLAVPEKSAFLDLRDTTLPDMVAGEPLDSWGAVLVVNASEETV